MHEVLETGQRFRDGVLRFTRCSTERVVRAEGERPGKPCRSEERGAEGLKRGLPATAAVHEGCPMHQDLRSVAPIELRKRAWRPERLITWRWVERKGTTAGLQIDV